MMWCAHTLACMCGQVCTRLSELFCVSMSACKYECMCTRVTCVFAYMRLRVGLYLNKTCMYA